MSIFERFDLKITNMSDMLSRLGVEPAVFAQARFGSLFTAAMGACQQCADGELCRDWLACSGRRLERAPAFCPNAARFDRVKQALAQAARRRSPNPAPGGA